MLNKVMLIGNLGAAPEMKFTQNGDAVANLRIATTESWKKADGSKEELTEWHRVVAFKKLADICGQYLTKGSKVYIEGRIQTRKWTDRDGNDRYITEIIARDMKMLSPKGSGSSGATGHYDEEPPPPEPVGGDDVPF